MQFPADVTIANVESLLSKIQNGGAATLSIPAKRKNSALGGDAAFAQALLTWSASKSSETLEFPSIRSADALNAFADSFDGLIALSLPHHLRGGGGEVISNSEATSAVDNVLSRINQPLSRIDLPSGPRVTLLCVDHLNRGSPAALYRKGLDGKPAPSELAFDQLAQIFGQKVLQNQKVDPTTISTISFCAFELFCNTHDHARFQTPDLPPGLSLNLSERASVRGISARSISVRDEAIDMLARNAPTLNAYLRRRAERRVRQSRSWFFELSVFDGGPGYAASLLGLTPTAIGFANEVAAVKRCFSQHIGRKGVPGHGNGLADVGRELAKAGAFFRLRTGRASVCAALDEDPALFDPENIPLVDWQTGHDEPTQMAPATGTLFTFLIPLPERHENSIQLPF